ncbi:chemotaxis protein [Cohnella xylanilytica]|uniref:methyl-accepting chemotaxis protein n=1 Tax=Cohnella xylanilytica TaxID=557555 RepID=UPI001B20AC4B|nr:methyl-accepting chemotaxis protein [Cohnella xylanilytica]GIO14451.1 chemotaxis protein [Cohnella xylanilytica]
MSVGKKLFTTIILTAVALSVALGLVSYQVAKGLIMDQVSAASTRTIAQAADKLDFLFAQYEATARQWSVNQELKADLEQRSKPGLSEYDKNQIAQRIVRRLDSVVASDSRLLGARLVAKSGVDAESYHSAGVPAIRSGDEIRAGLDGIIAKDGQVVWLPTRKRGFFGVNAEPTMTMAKLLKNLNNRQAEYVLMLEIKDKALTPILANVELGDGGILSVVAPDGTLVHHADAAMIGEASPIRVPKGAEATFYADDEAGSRQLAAHAELKTAGWSLLGYAPVREFVRETDRLLYITLAVAAVAVLASLLIGYGAVRLIARPIVRLCQLMEEGGRGHLRVKAEEGRKDEIGRLAQSFNKMMDQIRGLAEQSNRSALEVARQAEELTRASRRLSSSSKEIAAATQEIASGAANLASEAEKGSGWTARVGGSVDEVARANGFMELAAAQVREASDEGTEHMRLLLGKTDETERMTRAMADKIGGLRKSAESVRSVLEVLEQMTKQTNILSLNAAIEASRAGAAGRGFAVVADEIRKLADQSKQSIRHVAGITDGIRREIGDAAAALDAASPLFAEQTAAVREAAVIFGKVKEQMEGFASGIRSSAASVAELAQSRDALLDTIEAVGAVVQQTTASTQEVASISAAQEAESEALVALSADLERLSASLKETLLAFRVEESEAESREQAPAS